MRDLFTDERETDEKLIDVSVFNRNFDNNWEIVKGWMPAVLLENLQQEAVREPKPLFQELITARGLH